MKKTKKIMKNIVWINVKNIEEEKVVILVHIEKEEKREEIKNII